MFRKLCFVLLSTSIGHTTVFTGNSHWWSQSNFSEMEVIGAQYLSIENALNSCRTSGTSLCEYLHTMPKSVYTESGYRHIKFKSLARSLNNEVMSSVVYSKTISGKSSVQSAQSMGNLVLDAAKSFSITEQVAACHLESCKFCIPRSTNMVEVNNFREGAYWTTAESIVDCYKGSEDAHSGGENVR